MFDIIDSEKCFEKDISPFKLIKGEFDVCERYFTAKKEDLDAPPVKKRKKKNPKSLSVTDVETQKRHEELRPQLLTCIEHFTKIWPDYWKCIKKPTTKDQSIVENETIDFPSIQAMVETAQGKFNTMEEEKVYELSNYITKDLDLFSIFNIMCVNAEDKLKLLEITPTSQYIIPPKSKFLMGSIENSTQQLGSYGRITVKSDILSGLLMYL